MMQRKESTHKHRKRGFRCSKKKNFHAFFKVVRQTTMNEGIGFCLIAVFHAVLVQVMQALAANDALVKILWSNSLFFWYVFLQAPFLCFCSKFFILCQKQLIPTLLLCQRGKLLCTAKAKDHTTATFSKSKVTCAGGKLMLVHIFPKHHHWRLLQ